jgi:16S rRNA (uracil1498-N3)-methyltransferase
VAQLQRIALHPDQIQAQQIQLKPDQQHYLSRVLRLQVGDRFISMDGAGHWWLSELQEAGTAAIVEPLVAQTELPIAVTLMAALPKGSGFDEVVRQATELGVTAIAPILSDRTLLNPSPNKLERWRRIAAEAAEQSERLIIPEILEPQPFSQALTLDVEVGYICVTRQDAPHLWQQLQSLAQSAALPAIGVAIGPEGGWTDAEVEQAIAAGYQPVSLGNRILRAVTAPLAALALVSSVFDGALALAEDRRASP